MHDMTTCETAFDAEIVPLMHAAVELHHLFLVFPSEGGCLVEELYTSPTYRFAGGGEVLYEYIPHGTIYPML